jgi:hypothetical protein
MLKRKYMDKNIYNLKIYLHQVYSINLFLEVLKKFIWNYHYIGKELLIFIE